MTATCPHCGFESQDISPRFCSSCGARMDGTPRARYPAEGVVAKEPKDISVAGFCSSVLPGLGQVYNGEIAKGYLLFLGTLAGLILFLVPGILVWLYAFYDAYAVAGKMNDGTIEVRTASPLHMVLFVIVAIIVIIAAVLVIVSVAMSYLMAQLGPEGTRFLQSML